LKALYKFDCLRANKATHAWGVEARVPFLDKEFIDVSMSFDSIEKMVDLKEKPDGKHRRMEKYILRKAFDDEENPYLPEDILWRQKEQFSDGVGYSWIDSIKDYAVASVSEAQLNNAENRFPVNPPVTHEDYFYRSVFEQHYGTNPSTVDTVPGGPSVACSTARAVDWDAAFKDNLDPSGRAILGVHDDAY
jgi:asparagine synthase (glutamine-hydrolysing)